MRAPGRAPTLLAGLTAAGCLLTGRAAGQEIYFPPDGGEWQTVDPGSVGWDPDLLADALRVAQARNSSGVVILHAGKIMAESYWEPKDPPARYRAMLGGVDDAGHRIEDVASAQKSVVAALFGVALEREVVALDDPVSKYLGPGWSNADEADERAITIRHLLTMTSGLLPDLTASSPAGTEWLYNTPAYHELMRVLEAATGEDRNALTREWLTNEIGMRSSSWTRRSFGDPRIGWAFSSTARDLARFGLLIEAGGRWMGRDVLGSPAYEHEMLSSSQALNPSYGFLWWLNGKEFSRDASARARRIDGPLIPEAPPDLVAMQGALDRKVYVVPSLELVVVRLGAPGGTAADPFNGAFWRALMRAKR